MRIHGLLAYAAVPLGLCIFAVASSPACAESGGAESGVQDVSQSRDAGTLEEVLITAQKRTERDIDVPISTTVLTRQDIADRGARDLEDLQFAIPGFSALRYGPGEERAQMRGISSSYGRETIGRYLDEMPINSETVATSPDIRLLDMERIEILRGPQPTLYGDGSMGGTIRYVTASPDLRTTSASVTLDGNSVKDGANGYLANGYVSVPVVADSVGLRIAAGYEDQGGWIDRVPTGENDINGYKIGTIRAKLLVKLGDQSDLSFMFMHQKTDNPNQAFGIDGKTYGTVATPLNTNYNLANIVLRINLGFAELVETPGYIDYNIDSQFDLSPFYVPLLEAPPPFGFGLPPGYVTQIAQVSNSNLKTYSNELRLVSTPGTALSWAVGFDYRHTDAGGPTTTKTAPNQLPFELLGVSGDTVDKIWALWAEGGYKFAERWTATVGARYYHDETTETTTSTIFGVPSTSNQQATFTSTNPRVNLSYQLAKDQLVYVEAAKGFRSGGFNSSTQNPPYAPESLWTYELGSKGEYFDRKLSLEADVYYSDWKGVQDTFTLPNGLAVIENGGHVTGPGFDVAATWTPIKNFEIGATYGWNDLKFTEVPPNGDKIVGDRPDFSVRNTWSAFTDYRHRIAAGLDVYGRVDFNHKGESQITFRQPPYNQVIPLPIQDILNLRLGLTFRNFDVSIYENNATNERAPIIPGPFGIIVDNVELRPRVYGVTVMAHF